MVAKAKRVYNWALSSPYGLCLIPILICVPVPGITETFIILWCIQRFKK